MSRAARCWSSWTTRTVAGLLAGVALAGCGGAWRATFDPSGAGKDQYWVVRAHGHAKAVVVLLHGLGQDSGEQLEPWQAHLAGEGYDVVYPRYEDPPPDPNARQNIVNAVRRAIATLGHPSVPLVLVGHSRGGRLAVEAAAYLKPRLVIAFYPGQINPQFEPATDFKLIPATTEIYLLVGDRDTNVGNAGALELDQRLLTFGFPTRNIHGGIVRSARGFTADHGSVYTLTPVGKDAIWGRTDRLIANVL
jgi:predicted esterase